MPGFPIEVPDHRGVARHKYIGSGRPSEAVRIILREEIAHVAIPANGSIRTDAKLRESFGRIEAWSNWA
jgi:hypothetical protein